MSASWPEHRTSSSRNVSDTGPNLGLMIFTLGNTNCHLGGWFDKKYIYRDWLSVNRNIVLAKYQCSQCEYKATQKCNLQTHKKSIHEHEKFQCTHCEYKATIKGHLQRHIKCQISSWRWKVQMHTLWIQSNTERWPSETHEITSWRPKVPMPTMWIQSSL